MFKKKSIIMIIFSCILIFFFSYYKTAITENSPTIVTISKKEGFANCSKHSKCSN